MKWFSRNRCPTYHHLGWSFPDEAPVPFFELRLPDATIRLLDPRMHGRAVSAAGRTLDGFLRRARRGPSMNETVEDQAQHAAPVDPVFPRFFRDGEEPEQKLLGLIAYGL